MDEKKFNIYELPFALRKAELNGKTVLIKIYNRKNLRLIQQAMKVEDANLNAEILACILLDENEKPLHTAEYFLSDECFDCETTEIMDLWIDLINGTYKKKYLTSRNAQHYSE